ncbi:MAG: patatin-like phospholipase family protein [candidate division Zixibacteria bacterium]|nr:patatin-like phospholipase family protein [candidate division Zixibacteria bacterium]
MKTAFFYILSFCLLSLGAALFAESTTLPDSVVSETIVITRDTIDIHKIQAQNRYYPRSIGLALSGGGARGLSQIGVLKAFDEAGIKPDYITGTSMGSIIGGLYSTGYSASELENIVKEIDFSSLFSDSRQRQAMFITQREERDRYLFSIRFDGLKPYIPQALAAGQRLTTFLTELTIRANYICGGNFDNLPIPYRAIATDIGRGEVVYIDHGNIANAMRASMAFPLAFTAVDFEGKSLMDGGITMPVGVDICRDMGAEFVIAVNTSSALLPVDEINNPVDVANQVTSIMQKEVLAKQLSHADYVITPEMNGIANFDMYRQDSLIAIGYRAGRKALVEIDRLLGDISGDTLGVNSVVIIVPKKPDKDIEDVIKNVPASINRYINSELISDALAYADQRKIFNRMEIKITSEPDQVTVQVSGRKNHPAHLINYRFMGNTVIPDSILCQFFPTSLDSILSLSEVHQAAEKVVSAYRKAGYDLAFVKQIIYNHDDKTVSIEFNEGLLKTVDIRGNERTRSWIIKANYPMRPGEPFDTHKSDKGIENIYGTGFFEHVSLDIQPAQSGVKLTINVKEKKFTQIRIGSHWDDEYQAEIFMEILDDNVFGAGIQTLAHAMLSSHRHNYYLSFKVDRLSRTLLTAKTRFYFSRLRRRLFQPSGAPNGIRVENRMGWAIQAGQQISRLGTINFEYRLEDIKNEFTNIDLTENHVLSTFAIKSTVETYNKFPYPDYGHRQDMYLEFSGKWLGGTFDEYTKVYSSIEAFWPLGKYINLHPKFSLGISTADLPEIEKFYIGGMYNFSGFRTEQLTGDKYFVSNMQVRIKLPYRFYLMGNFDYGNIYNDFEFIKIKDFRRGFGIAISLDSPFGPCDFGYGKADDNPHRFYLNIGLRF